MYTGYINLGRYRPVFAPYLSVKEGMLYLERNCLSDRFVWAFVGVIVSITCAKLHVAVGQSVIEVICWCRNSMPTIDVCLYSYLSVWESNE